MKIIYTIIILSVLSTVVRAQDNVVKVSPIGLIYGKYSMQYEYMLTDYTSINATASFLKPRMFGLDEKLDILSIYGIEADMSINGAALSVDYRLYSQNKTGPRGFYIAPYLRYTGIGYVVKVTEGSTETDLKTGFSLGRYGFGLKLGAQWIIKDAISIDWNFGGLGADLYRSVIYGQMTTRLPGSKVPETVQDKDVGYNWFTAYSTGITIGYAF